MSKIVKGIVTVVLVLIVFDILILFASMAQVATGERTGEWNPFWRSQAAFVIDVLK